MTATCTAKPLKPKLLSPANNAQVSKTTVSLDWNNPNCADTYKLLVRKGSKNGQKVVDLSGLTSSKRKVKNLERGTTYFWRAAACNSIGCTNSKWFKFTVEP